MTMSMATNKDNSRHSIGESFGINNYILVRSTYSFNDESIQSDHYRTIDNLILFHIYSLL